MHNKLNIVLFQFTCPKGLFIVFNQRQLKEVEIFSHFAFSNFLPTSIPVCHKFYPLSNFAHFKLLGVKLLQKSCRLLSYMQPLGSCAVSEYLMTQMSAAAVVKLFPYSSKSINTISRRLRIFLASNKGFQVRNSVLFYFLRLT